MKWLEKHRKDKFFLFFHTFEVHDPYSDPHEIFAEGIADTEKMRKNVALYNGKIRLVDDYIGLLYAALKRIGLDRKTLFIITSDHGETFYERGGKDGHGYSVYDEQLKVPLIMIMPGLIPENIRVEPQVRLIDIFPTIMDILGLPAGENIEGKSLRLFFEGRVEDRIAFSEGTRLWNSINKIDPTSIRTNGYKYIEYPLLRKGLKDYLDRMNFKSSYGFKENYQKELIAELYDIVKNPGELGQHMLVDRDLIAKFSKSIKEFKRSNAKKWAEIKGGEDLVGIDLHRDTLKRLKALGYLQ